MFSFCTRNTIGTNVRQAIEGTAATDSCTAYPPRSLEYPDIPTWGLLKQAADDFPERLGCVFYDQEWTYQELWNEACRTAAMLAGIGVQLGDRVGLLLPNVPEYITALHGIWLAGGVAVAISPLMVPEEISRLLVATDCRVVFALDMLAPRLTEGDYHPDRTLLVTLCDRLSLLEGLGCFWVRRRTTGQWHLPDSPQVGSFQAEVAGHEPTFSPVAISPHDTPAYILPTGGTTGTPKAVTLSHRNLVANAWQQMHWARSRRGEEIFLGVLPFFHCYGLSACLMTGIGMAATLILHPRFHTATVLRLIQQHQPTYFHAVPAMLVKLNERLRRKPQQLSSIRYCISGGAPLPREVAEEFTKHSGAIVVEGYGLSEASPVTHVGPLDGSARPNTIGLPLPDTAVRIVDADSGTRVLPTGQVGELAVRAPQVMLGYWNNPEATAEVIRDGWLFTGDLATRDADGFFRIVDRKKDLIITSGFNVYPDEVENVLRQHSDIRDAAVIGVPDAQRGEVVKAIVVLNAGAHFDKRRLTVFCEQHLASHKRPRLYAVREVELPRNFLGKLMRRQLRDGLN